MTQNERFRDILAFKIVNIFQSTFKARLMDKLPLYKEAAFQKGVYCYVASSVELGRCQREFEPQMLVWLKQFAAGDVFYDIGANIGMFSLAVAKLHGGAIVTYAFEPSFSTFATLVRNIVANRFGDFILPFSFALGSRLGVRNFNYTDISSGASIHTLDLVVNQTGREFSPAFSQKVISYSLDELVRDFDFAQPTHIKIDVDGGEREIVEGMKIILRGDKIRSVMIELTEVDESDENVRAIRAVFGEAGFKEAMQIEHTGRANLYPRVSDVLFVKNWEFDHV